MQPSSGVRGVGTHRSRGPVDVPPGRSPSDYGGLTSLYPTEEGSSDDELLGPKILDDKTLARAPQQSAVRVAARSRSPDALEWMSSNSLNYYSSGSNDREKDNSSRQPGATNQSPSIQSSSKADDHDIEAANRMATAPVARMAKNDASFLGAAVSTRHTLQNAALLKVHTQYTNT